MIPEGRARVENEVIDQSFLVQAGIEGIPALIGQTMWGDPTKSVLVGSDDEFIKNFGGELQNDDFSLKVRRMLRRGAPVRVARAFDLSVLSNSVAWKEYGLEDAQPTIRFNFFCVGLLADVGLLNGGLDLFDVVIENASSGDEEKIDISVVMNGYPSLNVTVTDLNGMLTQADIERFNSQSFHVKITELDQEDTSFYDLADIILKDFQTGTAGDTPVTNDYIGSSTDQTGIHAFDEATDFIRIACPEIADPLLDAYLVQYVINRGDCRAWLRPPMEIDGLTAIDYRKGTGAYDHNAIDTWRASMVYGDLDVTVPSFLDPRVNIRKTIQGLTEVLANASLKDKNFYNWFATAGAERGKIPNNNGVIYNLGTSARSLEFDRVDKAGINAIIKDQDFGTVYWGNGTLQLERTLLSFENVAELLIYLSRVINPIAKSKLFDPNDPITWINIYRRVEAVMQFVIDNRGVYGYEYQGDQFVTDVTKVVVNTTSNLDAGQYVFHLFIKPIPAMKYVAIKTIVTNSGASFELL